MIQTTAQPQVNQAEWTPSMGDGDKAEAILEGIKAQLESLWHTQVHYLPQDLATEVKGLVDAWVRSKTANCYCNSPSHRTPCPVA